MNKVMLMGRLTRDVEMREGNTAVARFSVAVNRRFKNAEGNYDADFINCVAFGKTAEFISKFFGKGSMIAVVGRIQTGSYTNQEGNKVYTTDVVIDEAHFCGGKNEGGNSGTSGNDGFMDVPQGADEELPFN